MIELSVHSVWRIEDGSIKGRLILVIQGQVVHKHASRPLAQDSQSFAAEASLQFPMGSNPDQQFFSIAFKLGKQRLHDLKLKPIIDNDQISMIQVVGRNFG